MNENQLIVIGAGPGGYEAAIRAAQLGLTTALVENRQVGGTCLNRGCIPTKALLHAAALYRGVQEFESVGLCAQGVSFDIQKVHHRKNQVIEQLRSGIEQLIKANKIDLYQGTGTLTTPLGAKLLRSSAVPQGTLIGLDRHYALEQISGSEVTVEYDKLIDRQLERAAITSISGFAKLFPEASKVLKV